MYIGIRKVTSSSYKSIYLVIFTFSDKVDIIKDLKTKNDWLDFIAPDVFTYLIYAIF